MWDSAAAARAFFSDEMIERVTGLCGARPSLQYAQIATLVDDARS
ncbi:MAG TPA: hypothetical protein VN646_12415 [Candidatus Acidoferrum sp.]|nr:hypothetical protein [Candidatus Acidoferrum sp.]